MTILEYFIPFAFVLAVIVYAVCATAYRRGRCGILAVTDRWIDRSGLNSRL
jgi:hypothetical protein